MIHNYCFTFIYLFIDKEVLDMANPKDKEFSTNSEVKRTDSFQDGVDIKESVIETARELLKSTTEDAFSKMGYEPVEKNAGFYGTGKSYGSGTEQNKFGIRVAGVTKSSLEKQVMLGTKRVQSDIDFQYNGTMVNVEYKTTEAGFFRGVDAKSIPYTFIKTITVDGSKKAELAKAMKELFAEAAKKEVGYLSNTKIGVDDKIDKGTTSIVNENKQSMKKLTIKNIFSSEDDIFSTIKESKENLKQVKDANTKPLASVSPYDKGGKKPEKDKFMLFDDKEKELNEDGAPAGVTASGPSGSGAGAYLTPNAFKKTVKETAYGKQKANKRPKITQEYNAVPNSEGYKNENFWQTVPQKSLDNLKHNHIIGAPGMEGIKVNSPEELEFASRGFKKNGVQKESIESPKAKLDLTKKKMFSTTENEAKGINKRYLVTEKTSEEYLQERWKKLTNFKLNESINENLEINDVLNEPEIKSTVKSTPINESVLEVSAKIPLTHLEETITVQKPGSLFGLEYMFYKTDFLNEDKKYILDLNSKVFVPNPNIK